MAARRKWPIVLGAIFGVLVLAVVIGLFILDGILTSQAQVQAKKLSKQMGRPVKIGGVATKLLTGLGVRVSDVQIGAASGEKLPMVTLRRVEVKAALLKALRSKGAQIEINSAEIDGLTVNVIKLEDGKTNLEKLQERMAEQAEPKKEEEKKDDKPADLSGIKVHYVGLLDGTVRFIDQTGAQEKKLEIQKLSVIIKDLRAGKPLDVVMKAAVLDKKENFELRVHAAPLPPTLIPTPERVLLKVQPIDLAPIAPFVPSSVGLEAGSIEADFDARLGAAVPGGSGNTSVKGTVHARGLKFAGAEGGKALDVVLDTDIDGDAAKGDVTINKLKLDVGPAGIVGSGRALGLKSDSPSVEGLKIVSHDLDPAKLAALYPPLRKQLKGQIAGPIGLTVRGSGSQSRQNVEVVLDFTPVRLNVPKTLTKAAGAKMTVVAHVKGSGAGDRLAFDLKADLSGVDMRPGEALDKKPGEPLDLFIEGVKSGGTKKGEATRVEVSAMTAHVKDATFTGDASVELAGEPPRDTKTFKASLRSPRVDVDKLLIESKEKKEKPPPDPAAFAGLHGTADVKIDKVIVKKQELSDVNAAVQLDEDDLQVKTARLKAFNGTVSADGTRMKLARPKEPFQVKVKLEDIDLEKGLALVSTKKVMAGRFSGDIALDGRGMDDPDLLKKTLAGVMQGKLEDGQFFGKDMIASISGPLASKLPFGLAGKQGAGGSTNLGKELPFGLQFENGRANLKENLRVARPEANLSFGGGVTLDGILDIQGNAELSPQLISTISGGKVKLNQPIPVPFKLGGPAWKPEFSQLDLGPAVQTILRAAGSAVVGKFLGGKAGAKADEILQGGPDKAREEAEKAARAKAEEEKKKLQARAEEERRKAEARAKAEADKQRKKLEDAAKDRLRGLFGK